MPGNTCGWVLKRQHSSVPTLLTGDTGRCLHYLLPTLLAANTLFLLARVLSEADDLDEPVVVVHYLQGTCGCRRPILGPI